MISIILYGRNDNYGYNLHKRAALSLNCMAAVLTTPGDEILFVDYNTPDDFPTFPEAIRDTLTPRAQRLLRILRVRPFKHARFEGRTPLKALEPISRNVALRRSNPENRWILSTNTDMIFVPRDVRSLSQIASDLKGGFYHLPRFEIPEFLWESLDRTDPDAVIAQVAEWGWSLHLNEVVTGLPFNRFDGPGDFQLGLREDLFRIHGFDERMLVGWHVDSNLARRMSFLYGRPDSVLDAVFGYHCDHTRQATPAHSHNRLENDWRVYVDGLAQPEIPSQADTWGMAAEEIEEVDLGKSLRLYSYALHKAVGESMREMTKLSYLGADFDRISYDSPHVVPFLLDSLSAYPASTTVGWFGARGDLLYRLGVAWAELGRTGSILIPEDADWLPANLPECCRRQPSATIMASSDVLVFDFGLSVLPADDEPVVNRSEVNIILKVVELSFQAAVFIERRRNVARLPPRRIIAVNAINNRYSALIDANITATLAPIATRLRQGFVHPWQAIDEDLLPPLISGSEAGELRNAGGITTRPGIAGTMLHATCRIPAGRYRLRLAVSLEEPLSINQSLRQLRVEIWGGSYCLAARYVSLAELQEGNVSCPFEIPSVPELTFLLEPVKLVVATNGTCAAVVTEGRISKAAAFDEPARQISEPLAREVAWLPSLIPGEGAVVDQGGWHIRNGKPNYVAFGPYLPLMPGHYAIVFLIESKTDQEDGGFRADVLQPDLNLVLAYQDFTLQTDLQEVALQFEVPGEWLLGEPRRLEFRLFTSGHQAGRLLAVSTKRLSDLAQHPAVISVGDLVRGRRKPAMN